ncbi:hypothetical protein BDW71DRAFT_177504 [Aspergillus fruticulosus]
MDMVKYSVRLEVLLVSQSSIDLACCAMMVLSLSYVVPCSSKRDSSMMDTCPPPASSVLETELRATWRTYKAGKCFWKGSTLDRELAEPRR